MENFQPFIYIDRQIDRDKTIIEEEEEDRMIENIFIDRRDKKTVIQSFLGNTRRQRKFNKEHC